jgi:tripartite motif-containing protein 2/3
MFYKQKDIKETITCQLCKEIFQDPRMLPCGETACNQCIQSLLKLSDDNEFQCRLCEQTHKVVEKQDFPPNRIVFKLMQAKANDVSRNATIDEFKLKLAELKHNHDEFKHNLKTGVDRVREYCMKLRNQVHLEAEILIEDAHQFNEQLIAEIDKYEQECIDSFNNEITDYKSKIENTSVEIDHFYENKAEYLTEFIPDVKLVFDSITEVDTFLQKIKFEDKSLKRMVFDKKNIEFEKNQNKPDRSVVGRLIYKALNFENLTELSFNDQLMRNCNEKKFNLLKLDNGNNVAFYLDKKNKLNMSLFNDNGKMISNMDNITNDYMLDNCKVVSFNKNFLFYLDFNKEFMSGTFNGVENIAGESYFSLITSDDKLNYLAHTPITSSIKFLATNKTNVLVVNNDRLYFYYDSNLNIILNDSSFVNLKKQIGNSLVDLAMNDKHVFLLCNTEQLKIFEINTFDLVAEIETDADQIKLNSNDNIFLFNSASCKLSVHSQVAGFNKLEEFELSGSIGKGFDISRDKTSFVSFYNSKIMKFNLY